MHHYRKTVKLYRNRNRKDNSCPFCDPATIENTVASTKTAYVVPNLTQYDLWELLDVTDHLLVIPRRHVEALSELSVEEQLDLMRLLSDYEAKGYNVYARAKDSVTRSVSHQHTHLIKASTKKAKLFFFIHKPYFLMKF